MDLEGRVVGLTFGASDIETPQGVDRPVPADPAVRDRPLLKRSFANHVTVEDVEQLYEEWT